MQFGQDAAGELLAEFHTPLVVGIQVPDHALHKNLVFIERNQHAQRVRRELLQQDGIAGMVAVEYLVLHELAGLRLRFLARAATHQRFGLRQKIGEKEVVVFLQIVMRLDRDDEIGRNQPGALVQQLIEGMLAVDAAGPPDDGARVIVHPLAVAVDRLAVAFHVGLLQIGGQTAQGVVVGQDGLRLRAEEIVVPDAQQRQDHRHVLVERRIAEVRIHLVCAVQQFAETLRPHRQHDRQPDRRPQ